MIPLTSADAFGLHLIQQNPNPEAPEVKEIIESLAPSAKVVARRILQARKRPQAKRPAKKAA